MKGQTQDTEIELYRQSLFDAIEKSFGRRVLTSRDFTQLCTDIKYRTKETIGVTTMKRIYGYINDPTETRLRTLDILATYIGYQNWDNFKKCSKSGDIHDSGFITAHHLLSETLTIGALIRLTWLPDRICLCKYCGKNTFSIMQSVHTRLVPGTTFHCSVFIAGQPAVLDHVCIAGSDDSILYSIGNNSGIQYDVLTP